jgi:peptidoglycan hydrolase-like protein with peptidoglycan-binding domain
MKSIGKLAVAITAAVVILVSLGATAYAAGDILKRGSKGSEVEELQALLQNQGFFNYDKITGYFGKITEDAVKSFQNANGLKADGIVGEQTWEKLISLDGAPDGAAYYVETAEPADVQADVTDTPTPSPNDIPSGTLSEGMEGEEVIRVQTRLQELGLYGYSRITGYYGSITEDAVKSFQKSYGLEPDGVVGPQTMEKLFSTYKETSLIPGLKSDEVKDLQERLKELGYYSYSVDGDYGSKTREAVIYFQSAHGLSADGVAGTQTKQILYSSAAMTEQDARRKLANKYQEEPEQPDEEPAELSAEGKTKADKAIEIAKSKIGSPYVYATEGPDTFDCSGFTTYVMKQLGISLPRSAYNQGYDQYGVKITDRENLQPGDLVFFDTNNSDGDLSDHAGIYIGNGDFIHANSGYSDAVCISNLDTSSFYKAAFSWGRRVLD